MIGTTIRAAAPPLGRSVATWVSRSRPSPQRHGKPLLKKGDEIEVKCARLAHGGQGVCFVGPQQTVLFCDGALPGEVLKACVTKVPDSCS